MEGICPRLWFLCYMMNDVFSQPVWMRCTKVSVAFTPVPADKGRSVASTVVSWGQTQRQGWQCKASLSEPAFSETFSLAWVSLKHHQNQPSLPSLLLPQPFGGSVAGIWAKQLIPSSHNNAVHASKEASMALHLWEARKRDCAGWRRLHSPHLQSWRLGQMHWASSLLCWVLRTSRASLMLSFTAHEGKHHLRHGQLNSIFYSGLLHIWNPPIQSQK